MGEEPIRISGHHVPCLALHGGWSYTQGHAAHIARNIVNRIHARAPILLVVGQDDLCASAHANAQDICLHAGSCRRTNIDIVDRRSIEILSTLLPNENIREGNPFSLSPLRTLWLRLCFLQNAFSHCKRCQLYPTRCRPTAESGFRTVALFPSAVPARGEREIIRDAYLQRQIFDASLRQNVRPVFLPSFPLI